MLVAIPGARAAHTLYGRARSSINARERERQCHCRWSNGACSGTYVSGPILALSASTRSLTDCAVLHGR